MSRGLIAGGSLATVAVVAIVLWLFLARPGVGAAGPTPTFPPPTGEGQAAPPIGATPDCTIGKMAERYQIVLSGVDTGSASDRAGVRSYIAEKFPRATIQEHAIATVAAKQDPSIDGRTVIIYLLAGDTGPIPGGPDGHPPVIGMCDMTFFDAETEAFISSLGHATFLPTEPTAAVS
jgi:hypothetical protein